MKLAVLVDFDGTVSEKDASYAVLERFSHEDWRTIENEAMQGRITIPDALKVQAGMVKATALEAHQYLIENIRIREGFREFALWCRQMNIPLEICSDGFGWTIEVLLKEWDLHWIPWTSNTTVPKAEGWDISFPHRKEGCPINANCKCSHLDRLKRDGAVVIFVGDGTTDACVSRIADVVIARDYLLELCGKENRDCIAWESWKDVKRAVESLLSDPSFGKRYGISQPEIPLDL
jgi:2,3-diketo-5-methylthio-1-phosphopentane phosphatase